MFGSLLECGLLGKILLAAVLGSVLGYEREIRKKPAGLCTRMFVCAAAALLTGLGPLVVLFYQGLSLEIVRANQKPSFHARDTKLCRSVILS